MLSIRKQLVLSICCFCISFYFLIMLFLFFYLASDSPTQIEFPILTAITFELTWKTSLLGIFIGFRIKKNGFKYSIITLNVLVLICFIDKVMEFYDLSIAL